MLVRIRFETALHRFGLILSRQRLASASLRQEVADVLFQFHNVRILASSNWVIISIDKYVAPLHASAHQSFVGISNDGF